MGRLFVVDTENTNDYSFIHNYNYKNNRKYGDMTNYDTTLTIEFENYKGCANRIDLIRGWNDNIHYKNFNTVFEAAWKNKEPLRKIKSIEFTEDVLNWFLGLESLEISEDKVKELKAVRPKVTIKKQVMNERRVRFLFTLFVWSKIQENYLEKYNMHYLRGYEKKFKENADLNSSFNLKNERNLLFDLGFININHALGIDAIFMNNDVFKIPVIDENRIVLSGEDLYNCGYWLEKQKYGYYVCHNCGKEVLKKNKPKGGRPNKYCPECAKKIENDLLTLFGLNNVVDKKERLIVDEANANNDYINRNVDLLYKNRKIACDKINEKFGLNINVKRVNNIEEIHYIEEV